MSKQTANLEVNQLYESNIIAKEEIPTISLTSVYFSNYGK